MYLQTQPSGLTTFLTALMPYFIGFFTIVIPAFAAYLVQKMNTNHAATLATAQLVATHTDQLTSIENKVDAIPKA